MQNEAKQVGIIYHFSKIENIKILANPIKMKEFDAEIFEFVSNNGHLSTTRSFAITSFKYADLNSSSHPIRIALDGNKISERYKVTPINGLGTNNTEIFGTNLNHLRVPHKSETEEVISPLNNAQLFKMKNYILEIQINGYTLKEGKAQELKEMLNVWLNSENINADVNIVRKCKPYKVELLETIASTVTAEYSMEDAICYTIENIVS